jgi:hypothetical protein
MGSEQGFIELRARRGQETKDQVICVYMEKNKIRP